MNRRPRDPLDVRPVRRDRLRAELRRAEITAVEAVLLAGLLIAFAVTRGLLRRIVSRADAARSQVRRRVDAFLES